jgi:predicted O-methyltransferase YrrM
MPGYGKQTADAGRSFWRACRDMSQVVNDYRQGSLLASNFNQLWCNALNIVHGGGRVDYFAMLHDDIGAEDFWLDSLIEELDARELDVLGVAIPIKDRRGMTSLALHKDGDNWIPYARLSMHDVFELPETFTSDDLGRPLLINTGLWVCRWNQEWCRQVHFTINDEIVFNTACNRYQAATEPEDWFFSRLCHELNLKIGATRKIHALHRGEMDFPNMKPWGTNAFDEESLPFSPVPNAFPWGVSGWLRPEEGRALARLADGKRVLEIGSYCGLSTICMARTAKHVTAVDYFDGRATPAPFSTFEMFQKNISRYGVADRILTCHPEDPYPFSDYDFAFIDGAHDAESVRVDVIRATAAMKSGGLLAFHDYRQKPGDVDGRWDPGVTAAVNDLVQRGGKILETCGTLAVVQPPNLIA